MSEPNPEQCGIPMNLGSNMAVAIYPTHQEAEVAVKELQELGFDMGKLSIVGADYHTDEHVVGYYNVGERMKVWGKYGAFWGGVWGLLFGSAFFLVPGIGPMMMAGPIVAALVSTLQGAAIVGGLSALSAALVSLGVPKNKALQYETEIVAGKFVLIIHGTQEDVTKARELLEKTSNTGVCEQVF
ncbi:MAG: hypothetical protein ACYC0V_03370 [Armatimonadota bacterium]